MVRSRPTSQNSRSSSSQLSSSKAVIPPHGHSGALSPSQWSVLDTKSRKSSSDRSIIYARMPSNMYTSLPMLITSSCCSSKFPAPQILRRGLSLGVGELGSSGMQQFQNNLVEMRARSICGSTWWMRIIQTDNKKESYSEATNG